MNRKGVPSLKERLLAFCMGSGSYVVRRVIRSGLEDGDEHVEFQGDGEGNGLSAAQVNMTPLHALDPIRKPVVGSKDRTTRVGIGHFLTPAAIAQFMASLVEDGHDHVRLLDPRTGAGRGPAPP